MSSVKTVLLLRRMSEVIPGPFTLQVLRLTYTSVHTHESGTSEKKTLVKEHKKA